MKLKGRLIQLTPAGALALKPFKFHQPRLHLEVEGHKIPVAPLKTLSREKPREKLIEKLEENLRKLEKILQQPTTHAENHYAHQVASTVNKLLIKLNLKPPPNPRPEKESLYNFLTQAGKLLEETKRSIK